MPNTHIKPFNLLDTRALRQERMAVVDAAQECIRLAQVFAPLPLRDYGRFRAPGWREGDRLAPHLSVDWYVAQAWNPAKDMLNASRLLDALAEEPWRQEHMQGDHYDLWLVDQELYDESPLAEDAGVVAACRPEVGLVLSASLFDQLALPTYSLLKTAALHELGHLFGLPGLHRGHIDYENGLHCTQPCVMRHAGRDVGRWMELTEDRLRRGPYCEECLAELQAYFREEIRWDETA